MCKFHTENGCDRWECVFEEEPDDCEYYEKERGDMTDDLISRQAVQDYIAKYLSQYLYNDVRETVEVIDEYIGELPSVNPQEPKTGHWTHDGSHWKNRFICSECGYKLFEEQTNYCPNCGAKMIEPQERSDKE